MMNRAQKRVVEVEVIADAYKVIESLKDSRKYDVEYYENAKEEWLEKQELPFPEVADTSYYDDNIERLKIELEITGKILEAIYKMM